MPRHIEPRWNEDGVLELPEEPLTSAQLDTIVSHLGVCSEEELAGARDRVTEIAQQYLVWTAQDEGGPTRAWNTGLLTSTASTAARLTDRLDELPRPARRQLEDALAAGRTAQEDQPGGTVFLLATQEQLRRICRKTNKDSSLHTIAVEFDELLHLLTDMDQSTHWELVLSLASDGDVSRLRQCNPSGFEEIQERLGILAKAAGRKAGELAGKKGPTPMRTLPFTVEALADLYEEVTGRTATHSPSKNSEYVGSPQSAAGKFMEAFFKCVDDDLPPERISTALTRLRKMRNGRSPTT